MSTLALPAHEQRTWFCAHVCRPSGRYAVMALWLSGMFCGLVVSLAPTLGAQPAQGATGSGQQTLPWTWYVPLAIAILQTFLIPATQLVMDNKVMKHNVDPGAHPGSKHLESVEAKVESLRSGVEARIEALRNELSGEMKGLQKAIGKITPRRRATDPLSIDDGQESGGHA